MTGGPEQPPAPHAKKPADPAGFFGAGRPEERAEERGIGGKDSRGPARRPKRLTCPETSGCIRHGDTGTTLFEVAEGEERFRLTPGMYAVFFP
ncbi:hypothetical protein ABH899_000232 [Paenibacillus sp. RC84]